MPQPADYQKKELDTAIWGQGGGELPPRSDTGVTKWLKREMGGLISAAVEATFQKCLMSMWKEFCAAQATPNKLVYRKSDLPKVLSVSKGTIDNWRNPGSAYYDPTFPQPIPLGNTNSKRCAIGWRVEEVRAWINNLPYVTYTPHQVNMTYFGGDGAMGYQNGASARGNYW